MLKKNDIIHINIEDISIEGAGIGKYKGMVVFVPKALPEEIVEAKIIKVTKSYAVARVINIEETSKHRVEPFCKLFEQCGGCSLQHLDYQQQLAFKARHIKECFKRLGGIDIELPSILAADNIRDYRNKAAFPVAEENGRVEAGFYATRSHRLIVGDCPIQKQQINNIKNNIIRWANENGIEAYNEKTGKGVLRHIVVRQASNGELMAGLVTRDKVIDHSLITSLCKVSQLKSVVQNVNNTKGNVILGEETRVLYGDEYITEKYEGLSFRVALTSFLQVNYEQTYKLYQVALLYANISKKDIVFDLFCGIGTISLLAAKRAKKVIGIEYVQSAIDNAIDNAKRNGINNTHFIAGDAGQMLDEGVRNAGNPDIIILDPPRKGCEQSLINKIVGISPSKIVYVSCNPATLARDIALLCKKGYFLNKVCGVDMFSHTTHVECCCLLVRE